MPRNNDNTAARSGCVRKLAEYELVSNTVSATAPWTLLQLNTDWNLEVKVK